MTNNKILMVQSVPVTVLHQSDADFISLTDMVRQSENGSAVIDNWLRNKNTLEFLSVWEEIYNPAFNSLEFEEIKKDAGFNRFTMSVKQWLTRTNATGLIAKAGRYGGTCTHKIRKINYRIHTDAIAQTLIPTSLTPFQTGLVYATEADVLNAALFCTTAKQWREQNPDAKGNLRDHATVEQLVVLSNLESITGVNEVGYSTIPVIASEARQSMPPEVPVVRIDPRYFRPTEVETLLGDPSKAKQKLGWVPEITAQEMCAEMVAHDLAQAKQHALLKQHGYNVNVSIE